jgi:hypothetical protein
MGWARDHYHMASNFHGVLIFVIFVVDLQSRKFPPTKINAYLIYERRGQKHLHHYSTYCHPVDGVFVTNIVLSHTICPNFLQKWLGDKEIEQDRERVLITSSFVQRRTPGLGCCHDI